MKNPNFYQDYSVKYNRAFSSQDRRTGIRIARKERKAFVIPGLLNETGIRVEEYLC